MVEQFLVQPSSNLGALVLMLLVGTGVFVIVLALVTGRRAKTIRRTFIAIMVIGAVIVVSGVLLFFAVNASSIIAVGPGYVNIESPSFSGAGNMNISSDEIASAYVGQLGSGNLTLSKQHGTNYDHFNVGIFTLGNGKTAYVVSDNYTDLIVLLKSGEYVILGTSDTDALATSISQLVYPIGSQASTLACPDPPCSRLTL
jgi:hypothetical protein